MDHGQNNNESYDPSGITVGPSIHPPVWGERRHKKTQRGVLTRMLNVIMRVAQFVPVMLALSVLVFGYINFLATICGQFVQLAVLKVFYVLLLHLINLMVLWSYFRTIFTNPGRVPEEWVVGYQLQIHDPDGRVVALDGRLRTPVHCYTCESSGGFRYCHRCNVLKPDRSHHCSVCNTCVLRMDHHCPWVANCVGHFNYKYFYLFLMWAALLTLFYTVTALPYVIKVFKSELRVEQMPILLMAEFGLSAMFGLAIWGLFLVHTSLICRNLTTLESFRLPRFIDEPVKDNGFDLGLRENWVDILGPFGWRMFVPIRTWEGNGIEFRVNLLADEENGLYDAPPQPVASGSDDEEL